MRRLTVALLFLVLAGNIYAQSESVLKFTKVVSGKEKLYYVAPKDSANLYAPLPVDFMGSASGVAASLNLIQVYLTPANKIYFADSLTVTTEIDSISAPAGTLVWYNFEMLTTQDTLEIGFDKVFTNRRKIYQGMSLYLERLSVSAAPKIYIRRRTPSGTGIYSVSMFGY